MGTESPDLERPIHWRCRREVAIWPDMTFPVSSCLLKGQLVDGREREDGLYGCSVGTLDQDVLSMSKVHRTANQTIG
jgi:hypothetical protein